MRRNWEAFSGGAVHAPYPMTYRKPKGMTDDQFGEWCLGFLEDQILRYVAYPDRIAGAIFEPVALEAGVWIPPKNFVRGLRKLADEHGWFFIADEVEAGLGRTVKMWGIEIRRDAEVIDPPHLPGTTKPGLDLVRDEEPSVLIGEFAKPAHEILRRDPDARLQGDRLEDGPRDAIRIGHVPEDLVLQESEAPLSELIVRHALRFPVRHWVRRMDGASGEGLPVPSHPRCEGAKRGRSDAEPVILSHEAEHQRPTARLDCVLDGPFRRSGARELEEHAGQVVRRANREQPLRDVDHGEMRIHEEDEETVALERVHGRLQDLRMDVPEGVRRPLAREVDVLLALDVVQEGALRGRDHDVRELRVVGPEVLRIEFGVALPIPVRGALRTDRRPRPFLGHLRGERPSGHRAFGGGVYEAR